MLRIYRRMDVKKKLTLWGSMASIVALAITLASAPGVSGNQSANGNQSPAIGENKGDIIYNNYSSAPKAKSYVLKNNKAGASLIVLAPTIAAATDKTQHVCLAIAGTPVTLTGETASLHNIEMWQKVVVTDGPCSGREGWVAVENVSYE